jgi:hypothetical protein
MNNENKFENNKNELNEEVLDGEEFKNYLDEFLL